MDSGASTSASGPSPEGPGDVSHPQKHKRVRILLSCGPCRTSKLKCDRASPCRHCVRKGLPPNECAYAPPPTRRQRNGNRTGPAGGGVAGVGAGSKGVAGRLRRLERMVRDLIENGGEGAGDGGLAAAIQELEESRRAASTKVASSDSKRESEETEAKEDGNSEEQGSDGAAAEAIKVGERLGAENTGQVVQGERAVTWVGATHFLAMLDDIEDLKAYFDAPEEDGDDDQSPGSCGAFTGETQSPEMVILGKSMPRTRQDLLDMIPPRAVLDRLMMIFFSINTPSAHTVHRPTFARRYRDFWADPDAAPLEWLAVLLLMLCATVHTSSFASPHELQPLGAEHPDAAMRLLRQYRAGAGWALVAGKYTSPNLVTLQAFVMYVETDFMLPNHSKMTCYLLSGTSVRLMLKLGLHRDPSKLAGVGGGGGGGGGGITPFEVELRRRLWNMASQIDMLVSFHVGLPSMILGIESDTELPRNLTDDDLDEHMVALPPGRPDSDYTAMTYPIWKGTISRVFGHAARLAHSIGAPPLSEVARVDALLEDVWRRVPHFIKACPLSDLVAEPPGRVVQRYAITQHYRKTQCVLHRRYLAEPRRKGQSGGGGECNSSSDNDDERQKDYSRRACLDGALTMINFQRIVYDATRPGGLLHRAWFLSPVARHDYLLGSAIVYVAVQNGHYRDDDDDDDGDRGGPATADEKDGKNAPPPPLPTKKALMDALLESYRLWVLTSEEQPDARPAAEMLRVMVQKVSPDAESGPTPQSVAGEQASLERMGAETADVPWSIAMPGHQKTPAPAPPPQQEPDLWAMPTRSAPTGRPWEQYAADVMEYAPPLSSLSLADNNGDAVFSGAGADNPYGGSSATTGTPTQQVPMHARNFGLSPAVPMAVDGDAGRSSSEAGTPWMVPMDTEALDWTLMDDVIRANIEITTEWGPSADQPQPPLTKVELDFDPQFWVR
ncbi:hypothetical protein RB600_010352 [Gaeumannomyces tritici]